MSRIAKYPIELPKGVEIKVDGQEVTVKGSKGQMALTLNDGIELAVEGNVVRIADSSIERNAAMSGTTRALLANMTQGVSAGFERKLELVGVGYRAQAQGKNLNLTLGFSHPVVYELPEGITAETPSQTEIILKGSDKQVLGQAAAEIRAYRPPEPYKGKGVRYADEYVRRKEAKKK
ncbi:50S ribosomal protein L6 [Oceanococcus atlanticus]|uniref:Large ribosomal subunit protein uL6 n=1 Tax=Oceanococcus atlanticus TaxID=1317117 RepID=A0A1Y1SH27_9GAMM|nr:50S ribosomal protein L6 [Oceanococcus atlanticus]ORE88966.1 50S ribosomal protein L6 [Oceanococcus atlanticus]RZO83156.1 MAG: 50S ribosomal protein L6 [Oceanococcus sp.]